MKILLLHLSDIHCKQPAPLFLSKQPELVATLNPLLAEVEAVFLVVTGDIANRGKPEEYLLAEDFLNGIIDRVQAVYSGTIKVVMVPGNHDLDLSSSGNSRNANLELIRQNKSFVIDDSVIDVCTAPQKNYFAFEEKFIDSDMAIRSPLWKEHHYEFGGHRIVFSALNASWMSAAKEEQGKLIFPVSRFESDDRKCAALSVMLIHHPLNWYAQTTYHPLREASREQFHLVMSGHEHVDGLTVSNSNNREVVNLESAAFCHPDGVSSGFSVVKVDLAKRLFAKESFFWDGEIYIPSNGEAVWDTYVALPESRPNGFSISLSMRAKIDSLGAKFNHPCSDNLKLSDVFIYPDVIDLDPSDSAPETVRSDVFLRQEEQEKKVLIYGDDQYGKSSLLNHLFQQYHSQGLVPLLFDGRDFSGLTDDQIKRQILKAVKEQYGDDSVNRYEQAPNIKKIALLDNIDRISHRGDVIARVLNSVIPRFDRVVMTAGDRFDITTISSVDANEIIGEFKEYRLNGFGYRLRNELIRRWYQCGTSFSRDILQEKVHSAEQLINTILGKGLAPMTAFNVLVLLQTIEINERGALANAGLAQYYEYMVRQGLSNAKVKQDEVDELISYISHLAWEMYSNGSKTIDDQSFSAFNIKFSVEVHKTNYVDRVGLLKAAHILEEVGGEYKFSYPYLRYFFIAKYLSDHLDDESLKPLVSKICAHLYLKENANIVLFLTHHNHSRWIVREVVSVLNQLLSNVIPFNLERDTSVINSWIVDKAKVVVDASDPAENQKAIREQQDREDSFKAEEVTDEVPSIAELDQITQLNLLFKTSEILGQILKGRYGSIRSEEKEELLKDLIDAPLRAVSFFFELVNNHPEVLISELSNRIQSKIPTADRYKAESVAKRFIFQTVGAITDSFFYRQGEIIGSPKLLDPINSVINRNPGDTYKLVSVACQLSYPNHVPMQLVKELADKFSGNYFAYKVMQGLVARHMYMFSLPVADRQALAAAAGIDVRYQTDIELKSQGIKKLPGKNSRQMSSQGLLSKLQKIFTSENAVVNEVLSRYQKSSKDKK